MADVDLQRLEHLTRGLVGEQYQELYHTSASFYAVIDQLARMLPAMVDGLAAGAKEADRDIVARIEAAKLGPVLDPIGLARMLAIQFPPAEPPADT